MAQQTAIQDATAYLKGIALSYAQIYFSKSIGLGLLLLAVSFLDITTGLSGVIAILVSQLCSRVFGFDKTQVQDGSHTYNALMAGLALGSLYSFSLSYFFILILAAALVFFLTVWLSGKLSYIGLPFLSLPFLVTIWILLLGLPNFTGIKLAAKSAFSLHDWLPSLFSTTSGTIDRLPAADFIHLYLRSLSAILFQYNDVAGFLIAVALLFRSRMAFALSIYGFIIGYAFYHFFEGDFTPLIYSYIGFNFILTAIALGGFFLVPSRRSHLLLLFVIPVTALLLSALHTSFSLLQLPLYSLPFNLIVLLMLRALSMRQQAQGLQMVTLQQYSPEENHYKSVYYNKRFAGQFYYHLQLPVMGEWTVSQGYNGSITHKNSWQHALDFDVRDANGQTFQNPGFTAKDFYCYELPVLAPAAGYVVTIKDGVKDNAIGDTNLDQNWGNTIIIKHAEGLYTKLSHLKEGSFKVREGAYVQSGELIALSGNSGRSPEPHLHFQAQEQPYIGAHTLPYPFAAYLTKEGTAYRFHQFDTPAQHEVVRNVVAHPQLYTAFNFIPGEELIWQINNDGQTEENRWEVLVDIYNRKYLYCHTTHSSAFFVNDGTLFYFTDFSGSKCSFLYQFQLGFQKVLLGYYKGVSLKDKLLPHTYFNRPVMWLQDFAAPFFHFVSGEYSFRFKENADNHIILQTKNNGRFLNKIIKETNTTMLVGNTGIEQVEIINANHKIVATCVR